MRVSNPRTQQWSHITGVNRYASPLLTTKTQIGLRRSSVFVCVCVRACVIVSAKNKNINNSEMQVRDNVRVFRNIMCMHIHEEYSERSTQKAHTIKIYQTIRRRIWELTCLVSLLEFLNELRFAHKRAILIARGRAGSHFRARSSHCQINASINTHTQHSS